MMNSPRSWNFGSGAHEHVAHVERLTARLGYLVIQTLEIVPSDDGGVPIRVHSLHPDAKRYYHDIWPPHADVITWPPERTMDDLGFERFANRLVSATENLSTTIDG